MYRKHIEKNLKDTKRRDMFCSSICWRLLFFPHRKKIQFVRAQFFVVLCLGAISGPPPRPGVLWERLGAASRSAGGHVLVSETSFAQTLWRRWGGGGKHENSRMRTCPRQHTYTSPHPQSWPGRLRWGPRPGGSRWSLCWSLVHPSASSWPPLILSDWSGRRHWSQTGQKNQDRSR